MRLTILDRFLLLVIFASIGFCFFDRTVMAITCDNKCHYVSVAALDNGNGTYVCRVEQTADCWPCTSGGTCDQTAPPNVGTCTLSNGNQMASKGTTCKLACALPPNEHTQGIGSGGTLMNFGGIWTCD